MRVCGVMSGTSLDGIDVAIVDISGRRIRPVAFQTKPYPKAVREAVLRLASPAEISRMHVLLGELYAKAILDTCRRARVPLRSIALCGIHGQTIFHEGEPVRWLGCRIASTLQIGDPAVVAERTGLRVISNFRERDMAAGGKGAPLIPYFDYWMFRHRRKGRVALNIGGIANITVIPPAAAPADVIAFDTGPGNMVIDALASPAPFDRDGRIASRGRVNDALLAGLLRDRCFRQPPPRTFGREQFGQEYVAKLRECGLPVEDLIATATELTARTIAQSVERYAPADSEVIASGGGVYNRHLMARLAALLPRRSIVTSAAFGIDPGAKEAVAFAVLAHEFARGRPANLPSATGARRAVLLGRDTPA